jgi:HK97 family phage portal protein
MGWFDFLKRKAAGGGGVRLALRPAWQRYAWPEWGGFGERAEAYRKSAIVSACVTTLAFSFPEAPLLVGYERDGRFVPDYRHECMKLIRQPNPDMGEVELMQYLIVYASIGGNAYLWKQRDRGGRVIGLWPFSDANITPLPGRDTSEGLVRGYEFDAGDGQKIELDKNDVIHWKWMPDPACPWRGVGAIELAAREVNKSDEASAYVYALLKNNAVPPVVVTLTEGEELTEERAARLRKQWAARFGGENRGGVAFLEYGMTAQKLGFDLRELEAEALEGIPEARIAAAFRVPPVVAGLSVGIKRSDYGDQAARRAFTELTLAALWRSLASEMYNGLVDEFVTGDGWTMKFDLRGVLAMQEDESKRWERVTLAYTRALITRAEAKEQLGLVPGEADDVYLVSLANEFIPSGDAGDVRRKGLAVSRDQREMKAARKVGQGLRDIRERVTGRMAADLERLFDKQARRAVGLLRGKGLSADELIPPEDEREMTDLMKRWYVEILKLSWDVWNYSLGVEQAFDLTDPLVNRVLGAAGTRVRDITATTLEALREVLQRGEALGWSVDDLARGADGLPGIRDIIEETYRNRAETIARTELGWAQNLGTVERYKGAGVTKVMIMDDGLADDDEPCQVANGQIWMLTTFEANPLEHPNCTRAAAPYFGDEEAVR